MTDLEFLTQAGHVLRVLLDGDKPVQPIDLDQVNAVRRELVKRIRVAKRISEGRKVGSAVVAIYPDGRTVEGTVSEMGYEYVTVDKAHGREMFHKNDVYLNPEQINECSGVAAERSRHVLKREHYPLTPRF